jgi:hypothetical protein
MTDLLRGVIFLEICRRNLLVRLNVVFKDQHDRQRCRKVIDFELAVVPVPSSSCLVPQSVQGFLGCKYRIPECKYPWQEPIKIHFVSTACADPPSPAQDGV